MTPEREEIASSLDGRDITRGFLSPLLLQLPDDTVLMQRGGGDYSLYREVLRDDHVKSAITQRMDSVIARPWEVKPGGKRAIDKAAADYLHEQIEALRWDDITRKMLHAVFYGHAVAEVMWGTDGRRVSIADIKVRDRRRFGFDGAGRLRLKTFKDMQGELLPDRKFWAFSTGADHDDAPYGLGLAHWLYWPVFFKRNGLKFWAVFLEKFGTPTAVGKYPAGVGAEEQNKLLSALQAIQRDSAIVFPDGMQAELLEAKRAGSADHAAFVEAMNKAILIVTIGQTASTQGTPGKLGNESNQQEVRQDITKADADLVCMSFNATVAKWLTEYNFPGAEPPQVWRVMDEAEDMNQVAERDERLSKVGFKPSLDRVTTIYGEGYEAVLPPPATPDVAVATPNVAPAQFAEAADAPDLTPIDPLTDSMGKQSAQAMASMIDQVRAMADSADSLEALRDDLLAAYGDLDTGKLELVMALGFSVANLSGRYDVREEA